MPRRPLSFEQLALIGLQASPYRLLATERIDEEAIIAELLDEASEWPKRTKREVRRYGRGTPKLRADLMRDKLTGEVVAVGNLKGTPSPPLVTGRLAVPGVGEPCRAWFRREVCPEYVSR